ncbi:MAG: thioredoxin-disulfide reductase [Pseudomonadota bacterium]
MFDTCIIGTGPAGYSAGIYAVRAGLKVVMISGKDQGGQLMKTLHVDNYPGTPNISGFGLMQSMQKQVHDLGLKEVSDHVESLKVIDNQNIEVQLYKRVINAKTVILATGSSPKLLSIPTLQKYWNRGVSTCAVCDGTRYKGADVVVIGGGNTAVEEAIYLSNVCNKVYLIHRRDELRAEKIMQKQLFQRKNIELLWFSELHEISGESKVERIKIFNNQNQSYSYIDVQAVFIAIGHLPNSDLVKGIVDLDDHGYVITKDTCTNVPNIFAAGDVQDYKYRQAITAAGTGCIAALQVEKYITRL